MIPAGELDTILDNIGVPQGGFNLAFGDSPVIGENDGDILISMTEDHTPTEITTQRLRERLHEKFPDIVFFFEAANITNQILNSGLPAPIDVQVTGRDAEPNYDIAQRIRNAFRVYREPSMSTCIRWWTRRSCASMWIASKPGNSVSPNATSPTACSFLSAAAARWLPTSGSTGRMALAITS